MGDYVKENQDRYVARDKAVKSEAKAIEKGNREIEKVLRKRGRLIHKEQR